jgi:hypothetical protein
VDPTIAPQTHRTLADRMAIRTNVLDDALERIWLSHLHMHNAEGNITMDAARTDLERQRDCIREWLPRERFQEVLDIDRRVAQYMTRLGSARDTLSRIIEPDPVRPARTALFATIAQGRMCTNRECHTNKTQRPQGQLMRSFTDREITGARGDPMAAFEAVCANTESFASRRPSNCSQAECNGTSTRGTLPITPDVAPTFVLIECGDTAGAAIDTSTLQTPRRLRRTATDASVTEAMFTFTAAVTHTMAHFYVIARTTGTRTPHGTGWQKIDGMLNYSTPNLPTGIAEASVPPWGRTWTREEYMSILLYVQTEERADDRRRDTYDGHDDDGTGSNGRPYKYPDQTATDEAGAGAAKRPPDPGTPGEPTDDLADRMMNEQAAAALRARAPDTGASEHRHPSETLGAPYGYDEAPEHATRGSGDFPEQAIRYLIETTMAELDMALKAMRIKNGHTGDAANWILEQAADSEVDMEIEAEKSDNIDQGRPGQPTEDNLDNTPDRHMTEVTF